MTTQQGSGHSVSQGLVHAAAEQFYHLQLHSKERARQKAILHQNPGGDENGLRTASLEDREAGESILVKAPGGLPKSLYSRTTMGCSASALSAAVLAWPMWKYVMASSPPGSQWWLR